MTWLKQHLTGRKFLAFLITSALIFVAGLIPPVQPVILPITGSLVTALGIFVTGHAATDIKAVNSGDKVLPSLKTE